MQREERFRFRPVSAVPEWARFFTMDEYLAFTTAVAGELRARLSWFEDRGGVLVVYLPTGDVVQCGLLNIAERCAPVTTAEYPALVRAHFDRCFGPLTKQATEEEFCSSYPQLKPHVKVRLYSDAYRRRAARLAVGELVQKRLAPDLTATVVCDLPNAMLGMERRFAQMWGVSEDELMADAIANVKKDDVALEPMPLGEGVEGFALLGKSYYVSSQLFHLAEYLPRGCHCGAIVALPHRHILNCYPIEGSDMIKMLGALRAMTYIVHHAFRDFQQKDKDIAVTPNLYWWRDGVLTHIPATYERRLGCVVAPPQSFMDYVVEFGGRITGPPSRA